MAWRISQLFRKKKQPELRSSSNLENPSDWLKRSLMDHLGSQAGVDVTPLKAMGVATVYSIVRSTSKALSTLPLTLIREVDGEKTPDRRHKLARLLTEAPNDFMTAVDFLGAMEGNRLLRGNAYAQIIRSANGVEELIPLPNSQVTFKMTPEGPVYKVGNKPISYTDILHLKDYSESGVYGVATTSHVREVIGLAVALQENASKFFANGSKVADVLTTDATLSPDQVQQLAKRLKQRKDRGEEYSTLVLDAGLKYAIQRASNNDAQFMEARKLQREEIAAAFGIPASKAGILDHATFSNIEQQNIDYVVNFLTPICKSYEQSFNKWLLTDRERSEGYYFKFKLQGLMRGDSQARANYYRNGILDGWFTRNEVRELEDLNPIEGLDKPLTPLNMQILDSNGRPLPVPEPPRSLPPPAYKKERFLNART
tara:strand:+ start:667 stop:1947 length:1281 start_codon:yes stop_codon:yes gene_type:complete